MKILFSVAIWAIVLFIFAVIVPVLYLADLLEKKADDAIIDIFGE